MPQVAAQPFWVALGDSYSSGEGAGEYKIDRNSDGDFTDPGEDTDFLSCPSSPGSTCAVRTQNFCHRSTTAYSQISAFSQELGYANFTAREFHACSGAEAKNILPRAIGGVGQTDNDWPYVATDDVPQLDHSGISGADMVTLTIGGNDAMFATLLEKCFLHLDCPIAQYENSDQTWAEFMHEWILAGVRVRVRKALRQTCSAAPGATVYLLGYPKLFPEHGAVPGCTNPLFNGDRVLQWTVNEQLWLNEVADDLNSVLEQEAQASGAYFVGMYSDYFKGHEICGSAVESDSYFNAPRTRSEVVFHGRGIFHPTETGYKSGYRQTFMDFLRQHPPHGEGAPACVGASVRALDSDQHQDEALGSLSEVDIPTIGRMEVITSSTCRRNALPHDQQIIVYSTDFAPSSSVNFEISMESGTFDLGSATTDGNGVIRTQLTLPVPVDPSEFALIEANGTGSNGLFRKVLASLSIGPVSGTDTDRDGVEDTCDNCPLIPNLGQGDQDGDGIGDVCDSCPLGGDADGDGLCDISDPCPLDAANDRDGDGHCGGEFDNCPEVYNPGQEDSDHDFVGDACDRFPGLADNLGIFRGGFETGDLSSWAASTGPSVPSVPYEVDAHTVALWHFNESSGTSIHDETQGHTGVVEGVPLTTTGLFGNARVLGAAGSGNYITVPDAADLDGFPQVTVEAWILPAGGSANLDLVAKGQHTGDAPNQVVFPYELATGPTSPGFPAGLRYSFFVGGTGGGIEADSLVTHPFNSWLYLVGTYDGHRARIYVNGLLEAESEVRDGIVLTNANPVLINNQQYPSGSVMLQDGGGISGAFDEIRISNIARSASEISATYAAVSPLSEHVGLRPAQVAGYAPEFEIASSEGGLFRPFRLSSPTTVGMRQSASKFKQPRDNACAGK
jgi:hypothetical protein